MKTNKSKQKSRTKSQTKNPWAGTLSASELRYAHIPSVRRDLSQQLDLDSHVTHSRAIPPADPTIKPLPTYPKSKSISSKKSKYRDSEFKFNESKSKYGSSTRKYDNYFAASTKVPKFAERIEEKYTHPRKYKRSKEQYEIYALPGKTNCCLPGRTTRKCVTEYEKTSQRNNLYEIPDQKQYGGKKHVDYEVIEVLPTKQKTRILTQNIKPQYVTKVITQPPRRRINERTIQYVYEDVDESYCSTCDGFFEDDDYSDYEFRVEERRRRGAHGGTRKTRKVKRKSKKRKDNSQLFMIGGAAACCVLIVILVVVVLFSGGTGGRGQYNSGY